MPLQIIGQTPATWCTCVRACVRARAPCTCVRVRSGTLGVMVEGSPDSGTLHAPCTVYSVGASRGGAPPKTATPRRPFGIGVHVVTTCPLLPPSSSHSLSLFAPCSPPLFTLRYSSFFFLRSSCCRASRRRCSNFLNRCTAEVLRRR